MQSEDARYLKRKIRSRSIDVHPTEKALVVNYELEAFILGDLGDPLLGDKKELQKIIRLKSLNEDTDCAAFAKEVVEKCTLIHPSKLEEVEQLIYYLQKRKDASLSTSGSTSAGEETSRPGSSGSGNESSGSASSCVEAASINHVESYVELLYEGTADKVRGSALILQLARNPDNLDELGANESVLSALSRVLREDWKKSVELSTNIVYIFFCFSTYSQFHHVILQYKIGSLCMEVIDHELKKFDQWKGDLDLRQRRLDESCPGQGPAAPESAGEPRKRASDGSVSHIPVAAAPKRKQGDARCSNEATDDARKTREELEKGRKKLLSYVKKQDQLLRVSFYLLLNIAEDTKVEDKMCRKNIVGLLTMTLDHDNVDLIILILTFLKKLSVFRENVNEMARLNVVEKMPRILKMNHSDLIHIALRLLLNLSFDTQLRDRMVRVGLLNKLVSFLGDEKHETIVLKILYHMSMDDRCKSMFSYTDCVPVAMRMLLKCPEDEVNLELLALCINLAVNKRNAQMMIENSQLRGLMERAFRNQDSLIMKMIRNVAQHDCTKNSFVEFVGDIAKAIVDCESEDFVVECLGVLGNMTLPELDFSQLFQRFNLVSWVLNALVPVLTRWGSWFEAVGYVNTYIGDLVTYLKSLEVESEALKYFADLSREEISVIQCQAQFLVEHGCALVELTKQLEGSNYAMAHLIGGKLADLSKSFQLLEGFQFGSKTATCLKSLSDVKQGLLKSQFQSCGLKSQTKLLKLIAEDLSKLFFKKLGQLFNPRDVMLNEVNKDLAKARNFLPFVSTIPDREFLEGYLVFKEIVAEKVKNCEGRVDIILILLALKIDHPVFASNALKDVWIPASNVDSERCFSAYSDIFSDKRRSLKPENSELMV